MSDEIADLLIEKRRTLPKEDPTGSFIILTMGLFIEALTILAANRSLKLAYQLYSPPSQFTPEHIAKAPVELLPFARLTLGPGDEKREYEDSLFLTRRTSRTSYLSEPVPDQAIAALSNLACAWGQTYKHVTEPATIEQILNCNIDAVFQDLSTIWAASLHTRNSDENWSREVSIFSNWQNRKATFPSFLFMVAVI